MVKKGPETARASVIAQWDRRLDVGGPLTQNRLSVVADEGAARIDLHE